MKYLPSSISVSATFSPNPTTYLAIYLIVIIYLAFSVLGFIILVHRATCNAYKCLLNVFTYSPASYLSLTKSHYDGRLKPVSDSLIPQRILIFLTNSLFSSSFYLIGSE
jgi:hypothetical protein